MAHETQILGKVSEITAALALIANGWEVAEPVMAEEYDLVAKDPIDKKWRTFQVKSLRRRSDRNNEMVIVGRKNNGGTYQPSEVDYMLGVDNANDTVYMVECSGLSEYWASESTAAKRWVELSAKEVVEAITENNEVEAVI